MAPLHPVRSPRGSLIRRLGVALVAVFALMGPAPRAGAEPSPPPSSSASEAAPTPYRTTAHFRFFGDDAVENTLDKLADTAEERFARLCAQIDACNRVTRPIDIWVAEDAERFAAGFPEKNPMAEWAAGVTFLAEQRIVLRAHGTGVFSLMETFEHEVAHVQVFDHGPVEGRSNRRLDLALLEQIQHFAIAIVNDPPGLGIAQFPALQLAGLKVGEKQPGLSEQFCGDRFRRENGTCTAQREHRQTDDPAAQSTRQVRTHSKPHVKINRIDFRSAQDIRMEESRTGF